MSTFFTYLEIIITCISPIVVAWFGYRASQNEKQTKKYMESQAELKKAEEKLKAQEDQKMQSRLESLDQSVKSLTVNVEKLEDAMERLSEIDKKITNLVEMSTINFEFCTSLSATVISIGNSLDPDRVDDSLKQTIHEHQEKERELINKAVKVVY